MARITVAQLAEVVEAQSVRIDGLEGRLHEAEVALDKARDAFQELKSTAQPHRSTRPSNPERAKKAERVDRGVLCGECRKEGKKDPYHPTAELVAEHYAKAS